MMAPGAGFRDGTFFVPKTDKDPPQKKKRSLPKNQ